MQSITRLTKIILVNIGRIYSKTRIIPIYPPFFLLFEFDGKKKDDYIRVESHFKESCFLEQILITSSELEIISRFMFKKSTICDKFDLIAGGYG